MRKIRWGKVVLKIIFSKRFRNSSGNVIFYALDNYEEKRGTGAADVLVFDRYYKDAIVSEYQKGATYERNER